jgi:sterol desaturase/sphingolipid hydroxylase (fatty acid hydroxylase superfamily)
MDFAQFDLTGPFAGLSAAAIMAGVFVFFALLEIAAPFRALRLSKPKRWLTNLSLFALDTALVRLCIPLLMVGTAQWADAEGWGLLNWSSLPIWAQWIAAFLLLDLAIYVQHRVMHRVPLLWHMHKVHHSDPDFDVTTAARFHPAEIVLSMVYKMACVAVIGPPAWAVFVFEILFNAATIFTHSNTALPPALDKFARRVIVTPDMHRIHHSVRRLETDSNYGTLFSFWDRIFGSYSAASNSGRAGITIGMPDYQDNRPEGLGFSLLLPLKREVAAQQEGAPRS